MSEFIECADRVWVARQDWFDVNVVAVGGEHGLLVIDSHASLEAGRQVLADLARLGVGEVLGLVNTHAHFDHCFGNAAFRAAHPDLPIYAHEDADYPAAATRVRDDYEGDPSDPRRDEVLASPLVTADHTFSSVAMLDLGGRLVELVHPGRGHTAGDLVAVVRDAGVVVAGDVVEESGPPDYGPDCYPHDWVGALDLVLGLTDSDSTIIPGHGTPVGRDFVEEQRAQVAILSATITELAGSGVSAAAALTATEWPYPTEGLLHAVARGYAQLPRASRRLPLL